MTPNCKTCRFWIRQGNTFGECRRAQPYPRLNISVSMRPTDDIRQFETSVSGYHAPQAEWSTTNEEDWCGEHGIGEQRL